MGLLEFDKLPINTLVGADWDTFRKVTARQQIDKGFKGKYRLTTGVCRLLSALKPIEDSRFKKLADKPLEMDPLFILGHWSMIRYSFWDTGVAGLRLCIMFSPATSISATTRHTRLYFHIL
mgnify:CR=1 FL=1